MIFYGSVGNTPSLDDRGIVKFDAYQYFHFELFYFRKNMMSESVRIVILGI